MLERARARPAYARAHPHGARQLANHAVGLNAGADDYLPKPFDLDESEARLRALVAAAPTSSSIAPPASSTLQIGAVRYDKDRRAVPERNRDGVYTARAWL